MPMLETERLVLSPLSYDHSDFIIELVNEPTFIQFIGDRKVSTHDEARTYLEEGPLGNLAEHSCGMFLVRSKLNGEELGMCGLVKRKQFDNPEIGFAFLRRHWAQGYAFESAQAVLEYAHKKLGLERILAMVDTDNIASIRLLKKLGLEFEKMVRMEGEDADLQLFATDTP